MINPTALDALVDRARREVDEGIVPSCQLAVAEKGEVVESITLGGAVAGDDTRYVIFSCTKALVTIEQVLLHTSGFPRAPLGPPRWLTREGRLAAFAKWRLNWEPGTRFEYHATSAHWVLAELITRADGVDHADAIRRRVLEP